MAILDTVSAKLTDYVIDAETGIQEKETIEYGIYMFFSETIKIFAVIVIAIMADKLKDTLMIIAALGILRNYMGGVHAKTHWGCFLSYLTTLVAIYCCSNFLSRSAAYLTIIITLPFVLWAAYKFAPADTEFKPVLSKRRIRKCKILSFGLVIAFFAMVFILPEPYNFYVGFSVIAEVILILPITYKLYKIKYGKEVSL